MEVISLTTMTEIQRNGMLTAPKERDVSGMRGVIRVVPERHTMPPETRQSSVMCILRTQPHSEIFLGDRITELRFENENPKGVLTQPLTVGKPPEIVGSS